MCFKFLTKELDVLSIYCGNILGEFEKNNILSENKGRETDLSSDLFINNK